jgi:hypothetical protein
MTKSLTGELDRAMLSHLTSKWKKCMNENHYIHSTKVTKDRQQITYPVVLTPLYNIHVGSSMKHLPNLNKGYILPSIDAW